MPVEHVIYIPAVLLVGIVLGYVLGAHTAREDLEKKQKRARE